MPYLRIVDARIVPTQVVCHQALDAAQLRELHVPGSLQAQL
jgi:hypothetical protein